MMYGLMGLVVINMIVSIFIGYSVLTIGEQTASKREIERLEEKISDLRK